MLEYTEGEEMQKWFHDKRYRIKQVAVERREQARKHGTNQSRLKSQYSFRRGLQ